MTSVVQRPSFDFSSCVDAQRAAGVEYREQLAILRYSRTQLGRCAPPSILPALPGQLRYMAGSQLPNFHFSFSGSGAIVARPVNWRSMATHRALDPVATPSVHWPYTAAQHFRLKGLHALGR